MLQGFILYLNKTRYLPLLIIQFSQHDDVLFFSSLDYILRCGICFKAVFSH